MNIHKLLKFLNVLILMIFVSACGVPAAVSPVAQTPKASSSAQAYWPSDEWRTSTPEEQGMDSEMLASMLQQVEDQHLNLHSLLIVRNGYLVTEAYFHPYTQNQPQFLASVTKSVISTLVGIAIQQGYINNINQTLVSFFQDRTIANQDARKKAITLKDLLTLTAGLTCNVSPLSGMEQSNDWVQFMLDAPMAEQPGTKFNYCGGAVHLLSAILQKTTGMSTREFANRFLFEPIGIASVPDTCWQMDPQGISIGPAGLYLTPRDLAKLGYLYLQNGQWGDHQILPANWIKAATIRHTTKDNGLGYGYLWTVDPAQGSYSALGSGGQEIYVIPSQNLVIVFTGALPSFQPDMDFLPLKALVDTGILPAVKSKRALPANPTAAAKVNAFIREAANPKQVSSIPEGALQWSGVVYQLDPNPFEWQTISFDMKPGADTISVTINGQAVDPRVGLDNLYRIQKGTDVFAPEAMRGYWQNDSTLFVQLIYLGELNDSEVQVDFSAAEVSLIVKGIVNGQEIKLHGKRIIQ
jgi:CubicO group peptidase (beta-lactamase class C family)